MLQQSFILPPSNGYPLYITSKRYWLPEFEANATNPSAFTLICLHSTSFHKETWEPTIEDLFNVMSATRGPVLIRDVWTVDCPNHGESAQLNDGCLNDAAVSPFSCKKYAQAVYRFLAIGPDRTLKGDFWKRKLIGVGHSLGANSMFMIQEIQPALPFLYVVAIEPMVTALGGDSLVELRDRLVSGAQKRRDSWPTRQLAFELFKNRLNWDLRVLQAFVDFGIRWDASRQLYTLCCSREQEMTMYLDGEGAIDPVKSLDRICHTFPIHLILGEVGDFIPTHVQDALIDPSANRQYASVTKMSGLGHLIPQEAPIRLAVLLYDILAGKLPRSSRL